MPPNQQKKHKKRLLTLNVIPAKLIPILKNTGLDTDWPKTIASCPEDLPFLQPESIQKYGNWATLPPDAINFVTQAAQHIASDPELTLLAWHVHRLLFIDKNIARSSTRDWPLLAPLLNNYGGAFYLLLVLSGIPQIREFHKSHNVPDDIARLTYRDTYVWAQQYHDIGVLQDGRFFHPGEPGAWGLCTHIMPWLLSHLNGNLYRVGRLQYKTGPFRQKMCAYRHRTSGHMRLLCESGLEFRTDGNYNGAGGHEDSNAWTSKLTETSTAITGNPIHPNGHAQSEPVTLPLNEWECVLAEGDQILEIHIPADGPMGFDDCGKSLRQVSELLPKCFPDRPFKAICCTSWLLDPTYQKLLSEKSNIPRFQRECYLFPLNSRGGRSGLERIFGPYAHDLTTAPRDSSMRTAVLDHLESGGALISGGCLLWPEHLKNWGKQAYLNQFAIPIG